MVCYIFAYIDDAEKVVHLLNTGLHQPSFNPNSVPLTSYRMSQLCSGLLRGLGYDEPPSWTSHYQFPWTRLVPGLLLN